MNISAISNIIIFSDYINPLTLYNILMLLLMMSSSLIKHFTNYIVHSKQYYIFIPGSICASKYDLIKYY